MNFVIFSCEWKQKPVDFKNLPHANGIMVPSNFPCLCTWLEHRIWFGGMKVCFPTERSIKMLDHRLCWWSIAASNGYLFGNSLRIKGIKICLILLDEYLFIVPRSLSSRSNILYIWYWINTRYSTKTGEDTKMNILGMLELDWPTFRTCPPIHQVSVHRHLPGLSNFLLLVL